MIFYDVLLVSSGSKLCLLPPPHSKFRTYFDAVFSTSCPQKIPPGFRVFHWAKFSVGGGKIIFRYAKNFVGGISVLVGGTGCWWGGGHQILVGGTQDFS